LLIILILISFLNKANYIVCYYWGEHAECDKNQKEKSNNQKIFFVGFCKGFRQSQANSLLPHLILKAIIYTLKLNFWFFILRQYWKLIFVELKTIAV
jgi:hypothetical protein